MKIAFQTHAGESWRAGITCLVSLLQALRALGDEAPELALVVWEGTGESDYRSVLPYVDSAIAAPVAPPPEGELAYLASLRSHLAWWVRRRVFGARPPAERRVCSDALLRRGVDCAFSLPLERRPDFGVPLIAWVPDLQHLHMPALFRPAERASRDRLYHAQIESATLIMVTAEAVRQDVAQFAPSRAGRVRVLPLVVPVPSAVYETDPAAVAARYRLPERFFFLPNQFWQHKNHGVVLEALRLLQMRSLRPVVVCTGNPHDHRDPLHFADLLRRVSLEGLREQFILLGLLPYEEVLALMRQSLCLLNPSLFEGFGLSADEARAVGKRLLLSDLPAHREQAPPEAVYFNPRDAADLADKMEKIWQTARPGPDPALEAAARSALPGRQREFGRAFLQLAHEAVEIYAGR